MRVAFLCRLLLLLALVQGTIVSLSTKSLAREPPYEIDWVDPSTGQLTKIVDLDLSGRPLGVGALRNANTVVYAIQSNTVDAYLATVDLPTGKIQVGQTYPYIILKDLQFDKVTNQTFIVAFIAGTGNTAGTTGLFEVMPNQTLQRMAALSEGLYGVGTYSPSKHIYFIMATLSDMLAVSTAAGPEEGTILYNVSLHTLVGNIVYDDTFGVLYVWGYNGTRTALASVDYTTGKTLKTFFTSPTTVFGPTCINKAATTMYSSLFDQDTNRSMIHSVDLASGKASQVPTNRYAITMDCL